MATRKKKRETGRETGRERERERERCGRNQEKLIIDDCQINVLPITKSRAHATASSTAAEEIVI